MTCRYSSYGRHFTKLHLLEQVAQLLSFYLHDGDTIVDFSCGANAFVPLVKKEGRKQGLSLKGRAFDIITSQCLEDFERCSWLETKQGLPAVATIPVSLLRCLINFNFNCQQLPAPPSHFLHCLISMWCRNLQPFLSTWHCYTSCIRSVGCLLRCMIVIATLLSFKHPCGCWHFMRRLCRSFACFDQHLHGRAYDE